MPHRQLKQRVRRQTQLSPPLPPLLPPPLLQLLPIPLPQPRPPDLHRLRPLLLAVLLLLLLLPLLLLTMMVLLQELSATKGEQRKRTACPPTMWGDQHPRHDPEIGVQHSVCSHSHAPSSGAGAAGRLGEPPARRRA